MLKVSERPAPAGRPLPAQGPPRLLTPVFGPAGGLAGWGSGPPTADRQHEISVPGVPRCCLGLSKKLLIMDLLTLQP